MSSNLDQTPVPSYRSMFDLTGRVFVVLGGGNGIGRQTCHALAQVGAIVVCVDRDQELASKVAAEVGGHPIVGDITQRADVEKIFAAAAEIGPVRGLVDIVGMPILGPLSELSDAKWANQLDLVLTHAFLALQIGGAAIAKAGGGAMVFVASMSGLTQIPKQAAYGAAKAALIQLVSAMALELGPARVRVNAVAPGFVKTPRLSNALGAEQWAQIGSAIPLGTAAIPAEIAAPIAFLCSDLSSHVTGQTLLVDGGMAGAVHLPKLPGISEVGDAWRG